MSDVMVHHYTDCDRGLMYAEACFETVRVWHGQVYAWAQHERRLQQGLATFGLSMPKHLYAQVCAAAEPYGKDVMVRLTLTGGRAAWGLQQRAEHPALFLQAQAYTARAAPRLRTCVWPFPVKKKLAKFTADYAETLRACHQAALAADEQALFHRHAHVLATATSNILFFHQGQWKTPAGDGVLPGVIRAALLNAGLLTACACPMNVLLEAEAIAVCNSLVFVQAITHIDGQERLCDQQAVKQLWDVFHAAKGVPYV